MNSTIVIQTQETSINDTKLADISLELHEFYKRTVDIIYAFIIGESFLQFDVLLFDLNRRVDFNTLVDLSALFLAYFITVISWIGYHKSITSRPHIGKLGNMRFAIDLFIVFLMYYLIRLANPPQFIGRITTMGDRKVIIYIPQDFHSQV